MTEWRGDCVEVVLFVEDLEVEVVEKVNVMLGPWEAPKRDG
jgi:hypothetical protein